MDCNQTRDLLAADADGELDLARHLELHRHLADCDECRRTAAALRDRRSALRDALPRFTAPPELSRAVRNALSREAGNAPTPLAEVVPLPHGRTRRGARWRWASQLSALAAAVVVALASGYGWGQARARADRLSDEAVTDHVRSLQVNHLMDVASTDQHTVKPWFAGRLEFSPPVTDLAASGFPLVGGRLEQFAGESAAALVYRRRQHAINLFIWPSHGRAVGNGTAMRDGFNLMKWSQGDLSFLAISEIPPTELAEFAAEYQRATAR